jgi:hypothetical protein
MMKKRVLETFRAVFKSECGRYLCRSTREGGQFEAWLSDGSIHWQDDDRIEAWVDEKKFRHPLEYNVGGYSAEKTGQKKGSFTLTLLHCDTTMEIVPFKGNTIIESVDVVFLRKVPPQNTPGWMRGTAKT